ncbi:MAG TPA: thiamine phosphate synthase [Acetobacteraceae bacterium]|jgi:thiamine-phosphate pyrophosphorylase
MDTRLVAWARAVKARSTRVAAQKLGLRSGWGPATTPPLWLFTDAARLPDPVAAACRLPKGLCGIVLRHDHDRHRAALGQALARICRQRRLSLVVAGDWRLARSLRAGLHLRAGRWPAHAPPRWKLITSSAHHIMDVRRADRHGATLAFLSPVLVSASHPGASGLGLLRWAGGARYVGHGVAALGGIDGMSAKRLPKRWAAGAGAISSLKP